MTVRKKTLMGEKVKARKGHILTDREGRLLKIKVHAAHIHDTKAGCNLFERVKEKFSDLKGVSVHAGYRGTSFKHGQKKKTLRIEILKKVKDRWSVLTKRGIVEECLKILNF
jgi:hypothetical protein